MTLLNNTHHSYGRADGVNALYIKRLDDAIRDGDPIRSIIRGTATNSNGRTPGITQPSIDGQISVVRKAYDQVGLSPSDTAYVEMHGTGTAVGDVMVSWRHRGNRQKYVSMLIHEQFPTYLGISINYSSVL